MNEILSQIKGSTGSGGFAIFLLVGLSIYTWFLHHKQKLTEERLKLEQERKREFVNQLEQSTHTIRQSINPIDHHESNAQPNKTILVVDDEAMLLELMTGLLSKTGLPVRTAGDGAKALESIKSKLPSVILLDMMMPEKNGYDVLEELRSQGIKVPIIIVSGYVSEKTFNRSDLKESFNLTFLQKPFGCDEMLATVNKALRRTAQESTSAAPKQEQPVKARRSPTKRRIRPQELPGEV